MSMINAVSQSWNSALLSADEGWQCRYGSIYLSTESSGDDDRGVRLDKGDVWPFPSGATVYYRAVGGPARISREILA